MNYLTCIEGGKGSEHTGSGKPVLRQNVGVVRAAKKLFEYEETGLAPYEVRALIEREKALTEKVKKMQDW